MPLTKEPPSWVQLQNKTMIRWINLKIAHLAPETPQLASAPTSITSWSDLQDGLVLIRLVNQMIFEVLASPRHPMHRTQLYYLKPLYPKPKFRLHKLENLVDVLQFVKMILNINVSGISADNIYDGDHKLILGFVWSLFLFDSAGSFASSSSSSASPPSLVEIKAILLAWINRAVARRGLEISNFNKDWSVEINRPDLVLAAVLQHYNLGVGNLDPHKKLHNLAAVLAYAEDALAVPHLIDIDDFQMLVPDEKCIVSYLIEWFKVLELGGVPEATSSSISTATTATSFDAVVLCVADTVRRKNRYETLGLRFKNRANRVVAQVSADLATLAYLAELGLLEAEIRQVVQAPGYANFAGLNARLDSLLTTLATYTTARAGLVPELAYHNYPELLHHYCAVKASLDEMGLVYCPSIKQLGVDLLSRKLDQLLELDSSMVAVSSKLILAVAATVALALATPLAGTSGAGASSSHELAQLQYVRNQLLAYGDALASDMRCEPTDESSSMPSSWNLTPAVFDQFAAHLAAVPTSASHHDVLKVLRAMVSSEVAPATIDAFMRLIPTKSRALLSASSSSNSISDCDFTLNTSTSSTTSLSDEDDFLFDEVQQKLDSQLSGTGDRVYDVHEFMAKLENGFNI
ncbi:uncharacterized protein CANTADRAFT_26990 [Suhomyces tanzawaensis NRRL Y-17324]|uniref:Calponin-homology (CH) domain-containing protein n=1 Tax=Suhomyces tanzawaensis NRRL Y-17324 TaxID=984487 RepID=A0A1E4SEV0_9ASCO|nr:uncharacterized protein CANTADRAFT_26990 [Suhomyces tanzawaensis NRRL Y-17324]ODV78037.1 hypothetical protein CANTADRAFT_26990 [Suhomyces tanzawaensis NRRL Y-17324]